MTLANYQFQFGSYIFGGADSVTQIDEVDGLESLPEIRNQDDNRGYNDGMFTGRDFLGGRQIIITMKTFGGNGNNAQQNFRLLQNAMLPQQQGTTPLYFQLAATDGQKVINARVRARQTLIDPDYTYGYIRSQYTLFAPDPRYYATPFTTTSLLPSVALGRTYDRVYDLVYGGGSAGATIINDGTVTTYPVVTITGPITDPTIANQSTGQYITVNTILSASDTLIIDLYEKTIVRNGSSARNLLAGNSQWFGCDPGNTTISFTGSSTIIGTTVASITYSSAFV
jgi:hypothetical protein